MLLCCLSFVLFNRLSTLYNVHVSDSFNPPPNQRPRYLLEPPKTAPVGGLHLLPKLKLEHIQLKFFSFLRVNVAAQLSEVFLSV